MMKASIIALGTAALVAASVHGAQEAGEIRPQRERKLDKVERRGIGLTDAQRQQLRERIAARRGGAVAPRAGGGAGVGRAMRERFAKIYDSDGDGQISDEERAAMREDLQSRRVKLLDKYDQDKDGALSESERAQVRADFIEFLKNAVATYDADGDGVLSPSERAAAVSEIWKTGAFLQQ